MPKRTEYPLSEVQGRVCGHFVGSRYVGRMMRRYPRAFNLRGCVECNQSIWVDGFRERQVERRGREPRPTCVSCTKAKFPGIGEFPV